MEIFQPPFKRPPSGHLIIQDYVASVHKAFDRGSPRTQNRTRSEGQLKWQAPMMNWIKVNTDGVAKNTNAFLAELWGLYIGMEMAWTLGFKKVWFECDSKAVITAIQSHKEWRNSSSILYSRIHEYMNYEEGLGYSNFPYL
ncbi:uncharacterized protein LOC127747673 [Arachis duranensis]|uniref:RNase H type-1 domain-containing protein n=2 Tax=Arachis TaxID=3817 RepID=A0A445D376_ARAHY|nr:uncharacterized protein LOC112803821 [Arachis hypogaea]XP_052117772.1 uncharacterized protein LOC127747673 [Arachis duranensis]RYR57450.1 hypothetical protein Ahy_A05g023184 [Arachis hypogaea]